jgi:signal peptidase
MTLTTTTPIERPAEVPVADAKTRPSAWKFYVNVLSMIMTILVVTVACVSVVVAIATHFSPKGEYTVFGHPVMIVLSGSMAPVIRTGDLVVDDSVSATQAAHLHVGQIISVRDFPGSPTIITHRIVGIETKGGTVAYVTKGDVNNAPDAVPRPASDVIGVFRGAIPRGGYLLNALHQPLVLGLLLASPVLWFIAGPLYRLASEMDEPASQEPATTAGEAEADAP